MDHPSDPIVNELEEVETEDFGFIGLGKDGVSLANPLLNPPSSSSLLTISNANAVFAAVVTNGFITGSTQDIHNAFNSSHQIYSGTVHAVPGQITFITFTSDEDHLLVARSIGGMAWYATSDLSDPNSKPRGFLNHGKLLDIRPCPTDGELVAVLADSHAVYSVNLQTSHTTKILDDATTFDWAQNGKELIIGNKQGIISQCTVSGELISSIQPPPDIENKYITCISWIEPKKFITVYGKLPAADEHESESFIVSTEPLAYSKIAEICPPFGVTSQPGRWYSCTIYNWDKKTLPCLVMLAYTASTDIAIMTESSTLYLLEDTRRASLPYVDGNDTYPVGMVVDLTSTAKLQNPVAGCEESPALPILWVMNNVGQLRAWSIVWAPGLKAQTADVEKLLDVHKAQVATVHQAQPFSVPTPNVRTPTAKPQAETQNEQASFTAPPEILAPAQIEAESGEKSAESEVNDDSTEEPAKNEVEDEPGKDEPGKDEPGKDEPGKDKLSGDRPNEVKDKLAEIPITSETEPEEHAKGDTKDFELPIEEIQEKRIDLPDPKTESTQEEKKDIETNTEPQQQAGESSVKPGLPSSRFAGTKLDTTAHPPSTSLFAKYANAPPSFLSPPTITASNSSGPVFGKSSFGETASTVQKPAVNESISFGSFAGFGNNSPFNSANQSTSATFASFGSLPSTFGAAKSKSPSELDVAHPEAIKPSFGAAVAVPSPFASAGASASTSLAPASLSLFNATKTTSSSFSIKGAASPGSELTASEPKQNLASLFSSRPSGQQTLSQSPFAFEARLGASSTAPSSVKSSQLTPRKEALSTQSSTAASAFGARLGIRDQPPSDDSDEDEDVSDEDEDEDENEYDEAYQEDEEEEECDEDEDEDYDEEGQEYDEEDELADTLEGVEVEESESTGSVSDGPDSEDLASAIGENGLGQIASAPVTQPTGSAAKTDDDAKPASFKFGVQAASTPSAEKIAPSEIVAQLPQQMVVRRPKKSEPVVEEYAQSHTEKSTQELQSEHAVVKLLQENVTDEEKKYDVAKEQETKEEGSEEGETEQEEQESEIDDKVWLPPVVPEYIMMATPDTLNGNDTGLANVFENVYKETTHELDTVRKNASRLARFVAAHNHERAIHGKADLDSPEEWRLHEIVTVTGITSELKRRAELIVFENVEDEKRLHHAETMIIKLDTTMAGISDILRQRNDPKYALRLKARALSQDAFELRRSLRQKMQDTTVGLDDLERANVIIKSKLSSLANSQEFASMPSVEGVQKSISRITRFAHKRAVDVNNLYKAMQDLKTDDSFDGSGLSSPRTPYGSRLFTSTAKSGLRGSKLRIESSPGTLTVDAENVDEFVMKRRNMQRLRKLAIERKEQSYFTRD
ncbi:hypothetical protein V1512DRAFT_266409 [Lipomyces arxii]|uniref:uncharacterized protein n=1 Tax=Lipomyces arxii TaxID=56418 RepID=UPI0034CDD895